MRRRLLNRLWLHRAYIPRDRVRRFKCASIDALLCRCGPGFGYTYSNVQPDCITNARTDWRSNYQPDGLAYFSAISCAHRCNRNTRYRFNLEL